MATKIVNNLPDRHAVPFKDVELGCFFLDEDGDLCIRTDSDDAPDNVFDFDADIPIKVYACDMVIPVNVTINIDSYGK